jgi:hypothetical protein
MQQCQRTPNRSSRRWICRPGRRVAVPRPSAATLLTVDARPAGAGRAQVSGAGARSRWGWQGRRGGWCQRAGTRLHAVAEEGCFRDIAEAIGRQLKLRPPALLIRTKKLASDSPGHRNTPSSSGLRLPAMRRPCASSPGSADQVTLAIASRTGPCSCRDELVHRPGYLTRQQHPKHGTLLHEPARPAPRSAAQGDNDHRRVVSGARGAGG